MEALSVIVTCYNKVDFVPPFLDLAKKILQEGFEIVIVDDSSTDGSFELLQNFADTDPRVKLVGLTENHGSAHARNTGIEISSRSNLFFLDIDDSCDVSLLKSLTGDLISTKSDLLVANAQVQPEKTLLSMPVDTRQNLCLTISSVSRQICQNMGYWRFIYSKRMISQHSIRFFPTRDESNGSRFILDDAFWIILISTCQGKICIKPNNEVLYVYNRPESSLESWQRYLNQVVLVPNLCVAFLQEFNQLKNVNSKLLQENTIDWLCNTTKVLPMRLAIRSSVFSFHYLKELHLQVKLSLSHFQIIRKISTLFFLCMKNTLNVRYRLAQVRNRLTPFRGI